MVNIKKLIRTLAGRSGPRQISLVLHIGMPKTGTTAIQSFLAHNRTILQDRLGIVYPACGVPSEQHAALVKSMVKDRFPWTLFSDAMDTFDPEAYIRQVLDQCGAHGCGQVILSSEFFWAAPAMQSRLPYHVPNEENFGHMDRFVESCRSLFAGFSSAQVVVYLRRQDYWIDSFFNQQLKDGFDIPGPKDIAEPKNYLLYTRILRIWSKYFGLDNIIVRPYDDKGNKDILTDFCTTLGLSHPALSHPPKSRQTTNPRLSALSTKTMRTAVALKLDADIMGRLKDVLQEISFQRHISGIPNPKTLFSDTFYEALLTSYDADNENLIQMFPDVGKMFGTGQLDGGAEKNSQENTHDTRTETLIADLICLLESKSGSAQ